MKDFSVVFNKVLGELKIYFNFQKNVNENLSIYIFKILIRVEL